MFDMPTAIDNTFKMMMPFIDATVNGMLRYVFHSVIIVCLLQFFHSVEFSSVKKLINSLLKSTQRSSVIDGIKMGLCEATCQVR